MKRGCVGSRAKQNMVVANKSELLVGLDIGTSKIVAVVGEATDGAPKIFGIGEAASTGMRKGVIVNIDDTVAAIRAAIREAEHTSGCDIRSVVTDVSGGHIRGFNSHGVVKVKDEEVVRSDVERVLDAARAVPVSADRDVLHVLTQDFVLDGQDEIHEPIGVSGVRLESHVHIVTTASSSAMNVIKCCQRAGLHVADLVLEPLAVAEAVLTPEEKELGVALVDMGAGTTDVLVFKQDALRHTAVLSLGGNHVTGDIATGLRTPFAEAEALKLHSGCALARAAQGTTTVEVPSVGGRGPRQLSRQVLSQMIEARIEEILSLARHQILKSGFDEALGSGIVLTGGAAQLDGLLALAEDVFETPVRVGAPTTEGGDQELLSTVQTPSLAAAVGLVQYGAQPQDYIPGDPRHAPVFDRVKRRIRDWVGAMSW